MQTETTTETTPAAGMRDALLDIAAAANDALYTSHASPEATEKAYAEALDLIRKRLGADGAFFTPVGLLPALPAPLGKPEMLFVKLPGLWAGKIELPLAGGEHSHTLGAWCRTMDGGTDTVEPLVEFTICKDGETVAYGHIFLGHCTAIKMVKGMLQALQSRSGKNARHRFNAGLRLAAAAPVNPPMDIPPRPGLPEDDE